VFLREVCVCVAGRVWEAEQVYREDLARYPDNGWALLGLYHSLERQGHAAEAQLALGRFKRAWRHADTFIGSSCPALDRARTDAPL
jgi:hypothetical protein